MKKTEGPFSPAPQRPLNSWLIEMAQACAEDEKIPFAAALGKIKAENPRLAEAARMEATCGAAPGTGENFMRLMRRAMEIAKARGMSVEPAMEQAAAADPDLAAAARSERGGGLYAGELSVPPGVGDRKVLMSEGVDAALDPGAHLIVLTEGRCREKNISYREALTEIGREHPELVRAAREQALARRS